MIQDSELPSYFLPVEDAEQQDRDQAVDEPAARKAEDVREVTPLEDEDQHAVGRAHRKHIHQDGLWEVAVQGAVEIQSNGLNATDLHVQPLPGCRVSGTQVIDQRLAHIALKRGIGVDNDRREATIRGSRDELCQRRDGLVAARCIEREQRLLIERWPTRRPRWIGQADDACHVWLLREPVGEGRQAVVLVEGELDAFSLPMLL